MAAAADKKSKPAEGKDAPKKARSPLLITALVALVAAGATGAGVWFYAGKQAKEVATKSARPAPAQYLALDPAFVVNLNGSFDGPQYMQVEIQLMTRDPLALPELTTHTPAIRARLLMLLSQVEPAQIVDVAGKQKLRAAALAEVQKLMKAETGKNCADDLLFTSFVTQ